MKLVVYALASAVFLNSGAAAQVTSYETPGNLKPTHDLGCISFDQITNEYTPADLMLSQTRCAKAGRYEDAIVLFTLAGAYARFDAKRVADTTAHDAFQVLMNNYSNDEETNAAILPIFERFEAPNSPDKEKFCTNIKRLGPPNYYPGYMTSHGMAAIFGKEGGLVSNFDLKKTWKETLDKYVHCDVSDMN